MEDVVVIGAGIVGLATARALLRERPGQRVTVLEKADDIATAQTGHNSGVIHAGIYYAPGSLKARLCVAGQTATKEFCAAHGIPYSTIGKLVVATSPAEVGRMRELEARARRNGLLLQRVSGAELREWEPHLVGVEALFSPTTGIVNYKQVAQAMAADVEARGGRVVTRARVRSISESGSDRAVHLETDIGTISGRTVIACAGLQADRVARLGGLTVDFRIVPFRGEYYQLPTTSANIVSRLIYPVPDPTLPFLGVHLSPTIDGRVTVGPNAVLGFSREGYSHGSFCATDVLSYLTFPGMWRFASQHLGTGIAEMRNSYVKSAYLRLVHKYCPSINKADLLAYPAGIRAQAINSTGQAVEDFLIRRTDRQVHVCNAPSPAATSAIPIGEIIAAEVRPLLA